MYYILSWTNDKLRLALPASLGVFIKWQIRSALWVKELPWNCFAFDFMVIIHLTTQVLGMRMSGRASYSECFHLVKSITKLGTIESFGAARPSSYRGHRGGLFVVQQRHPRNLMLSYWDCWSLSWGSCNHKLMLNALDQTRWFKFPEMWLEAEDINMIIYY